MLTNLPLPESSYTYIRTTSSQITYLYRSLARVVPTPDAENVGLTMMVDGSDRSAYNDDRRTG
jgi:hypothetical protein